MVCSDLANEQRALMREQVLLNEVAKCLTSCARRPLCPSGAAGTFVVGSAGPAPPYVIAGLPPPQSQYEQRPPMWAMTACPHLEQVAMPRFPPYEGTTPGSAAQVFPMSRWRRDSLTVWAQLLPGSGVLSLGRLGVEDARRACTLLRQRPRQLLHDVRGARALRERPRDHRVRPGRFVWSHAVAVSFCSRLGLRVYETNAFRTLVADHVALPCGLRIPV